VALLGVGLALNITGVLEKQCETCTGCIEDCSGEAGEQPRLSGKRRGGCEGPQKRLNAVDQRRCSRQRCKQIGLPAGTSRARLALCVLESAEG
jgi:hypothetical protein